MMPARHPETIAEVVAEDLCIGCGLCESVSGGRVRMTMTSRGALRPVPVDGFSDLEESLLVHCCPGVVAEAPLRSGVSVDPVWGAFRDMRIAWAGDPETRYRGATGGVLTALGAYLLESGRVRHVLHVGPDRDRPLRNRWIISSTPESVCANTGSRYGPVAPLAGLADVLDRGEPFAIIAKPCDIGAVHRMAMLDPRLEAQCVARLAMVCGGQSRLGKSQRLLAEIGINEDDVRLFRYRGHGNPGPTRIETHGGDVHEKSYNEVWEDESGWDLETRCKLCPDALGEAADIAAADIWPDASPKGEDDGFNGIVVRSQFGMDLVEAAADAGRLVLGERMTPDALSDCQPHQVRKKLALEARYQGFALAGAPVIEAINLRTAELGRQLDEEQAARERSGAEYRALTRR